jgi:hypothetical protein
MNSTVPQIHQRVDQDVERFASPETAPTAVIDTLLRLNFLTQAAAALTPRALALRAISWDAGNPPRSLGDPLDFLRAVGLPRPQCCTTTAVLPPLARSSAPHHFSAHRSPAHAVPPR